MLNRHQLRIKVFKTVYAYENCREANLQLAIEQAYEALTGGIRDKAEKVQLRNLVKDCFYSQLDNTQAGSLPEDEDVRRAVEQAVQLYSQQNAKDRKNLEAAMLRDVENVRKGQFSILRLLLEFAFQNKKIAEERSDLKPVLSTKGATSTGLYDNQVIARIREKERVIIDSAHHSVFNVEDSNTLRDWYKGALGQDPDFKEYLARDIRSYHDDWTILEHIVRNIIFKSETIDNFFEEADINWTENKPVIRSLILKTMKSVEDDHSDLAFAEISYNWDDDEDFYRTLFRDTIQRSAEMESLITSNLENWDINRIALTDKVILQTAICEMVAFPSIPVKVTINEYIEISKKYSTPKSKNFVNGLLDVISAKLLEEGVIRKSGRGLIDNK